MGVSKVVVAGRLGTGGGEGDISGRVRRRGGVMQGENGVGRDAGPVMMEGTYSSSKLTLYFYLITNDQNNYV